MNLLDVKVWVLTFNGEARCAFKNLKECNRALSYIDPSDLYGWDWEIMTFREWAVAFNKLGYFGEPKIEN